MARDRCLACAGRGPVIEAELTEEIQHLRGEVQRLTVDLAAKRTQLAICALAARLDLATIESLKRQLEHLRNHNAN